MQTPYLRYTESTTRTLALKRGVGAEIAGCVATRQRFEMHNRRKIEQARRFQALGFFSGKARQLVDVVMIAVKAAIRIAVAFSIGLEECTEHGAAV